MSGAEIRPMVGRVVGMQYRERPNAYDNVEEGFMEGFFTGEVDIWGKWTFRSLYIVHTLYLFEDEILSIQPLYGEGAEE